MTGGRDPVRGRERAARSLGIAVRAIADRPRRPRPRRPADRARDHPHLLRGAVPAGASVRRSPGPRLFGLAAVWLVAAPVVSQLVRPELPPRGFSSPNLLQLAHPGQLLSELDVHRVLPGRAVARLPARRHGPRPARPLLAAGSRSGRRQRASCSRCWRPWSRASPPPDRESSTRSWAGAAPRSPAGRRCSTRSPQACSARLPSAGRGSGCSWCPAQHTPFDLAQTLGSALAVIGCCLLLVSALPSTWRRGSRSRSAPAR